MLVEELMDPSDRLAPTAMPRDTSSAVEKTSDTFNIAALDL